MTCSLCNSTLPKKDYNGFRHCPCCKAYVKDPNTYYSSTKERDHYLQHNNDIHHKGYQNFVSDLRDTVLQYCTPEQLGLDFGCGSAPVTTHLLRQHKYNIDLYDPYFYPNQDYKKNKYHYIFSCEVFEHLHHPKKEIEALLSILEPTGIIFIKTHLFTNQTNFDSWYYIKDLTHVFIYTPDTFKYIAEKYDLEIITMTQRIIVLRKNVS